MLTLKEVFQISSNGKFALNVHSMASFVYYVQLIQTTPCFSQRVVLLSAILAAPGKSVLASKDFAMTAGP